MNIYRFRIANKILACFIIVAFTTNLITPPMANARSVLDLPIPGTMVTLSSNFNPAITVGITVYPEKPLQFDMIIHPGDDNLEGDKFQKESNKLIKYFLASLTVPEDEMWVNLSPYEKNRIIPKGLGDTDMGRDLLAQDYMLKQLTASLMYPEDELGNDFWNRVYKRAQEEYGTTEVPMNTFNKVWIVPDKAIIYVNDTSAFIVESKLKVMLEEDYLALESNVGSTKHGLGNINKEDLAQISEVSSKVLKDIIIPELDSEVNNGKTFAKLRQIYNAMILARWYKNNLKESLLGQTYIDKNKTNGIDLEDKEISQRIYDQYVESFKKGVYDFIKEDYDPISQEMIPRKYFSGGVNLQGENSRTNQRNTLENGLIGSKRVQVQGYGLQDDVVISSSGTAVDHIAYNSTVVGDNLEILVSIANEIGAKVLPDSDIDFRSAMLNLEKSHDDRVMRDEIGNLIVTLETNKRYLILTTQIDPLSKQPELIFIDSRFGADHAGRTRNQVYAGSVGKAVHELTELRIWKAVEGSLMKPEGNFITKRFRQPEIDPTGKNGKPRNIREWIRRNIQNAIELDAFFHILARGKERKFEDEIEEATSAINPMDYFIRYLPKLSQIANKNGSPKLLLVDYFLKNLPQKKFTFSEMTEVFDRDENREVEIVAEPTTDEIELLNDKQYEVIFFQRKKDRRWYAARGEAGTELNLNLPENVMLLNKIIIGPEEDNKLTVNSAFLSLLREMNDIAVEFHLHPNGVTPPSPYDFSNLLSENTRSRGRGVADAKYFYIYTTNRTGDSQAEVKVLLKELLEEYQAIAQRVLGDISGVSVPEEEFEDFIQRNLNNRLFDLWKAYVETKGFSLERVVLREVETVYDYLKPDLVESKEPEDIIISSNKQSENTNQSDITRSIQGLLNALSSNSKEDVIDALENMELSREIMQRQGFKGQKLVIHQTGASNFSRLGTQGLMGHLDLVEAGIIEKQHDNNGFWFSVYDFNRTDFLRELLVRAKLIYKATFESATDGMAGKGDLSDVGFVIFPFDRMHPFLGITKRGEIDDYLGQRGYWGDLWGIDLPRSSKIDTNQSLLVDLSIGEKELREIQRVVEERGFDNQEQYKTLMSAAISVVWLERILSKSFDSTALDPAPGGIDLNPNILDLYQYGQKTNLKIQLDPQQIENFNIDGIRPTIINITPVINIPQLLGMNEEEYSKKVSLAQ